MHLAQKLKDRVWYLFFRMVEMQEKVNKLKEDHRQHKEVICRNIHTLTVG